MIVDICIRETFIFMIKMKNVMAIDLKNNSQNVHILSLEIIVSREGLIHSPSGGELPVSTLNVSKCIA
jgi:hypothetical protein